MKSLARGVEILKDFAKKNNKTKLAKDILDLEKVPSYQSEEENNNTNEIVNEDENISTDDNSQEENENTNDENINKEETNIVVEDKPVSILSSLNVDKSISYKKEIRIDTVLVVSFVYKFNKINNNTLQYIIYNEKLFNEHYEEIKTIAQELQETIKKDLENNGFNPLIL